MSDLLSALPIYNKNYIWNELKAIKKDEGQLLWSDLIQFDQLHYFGTKALDHLSRCLGLTNKDHLLEVGSGLGGPARYLAANYRCRLTGIELQEDLFQTSVSLTMRCGLDQEVDFVHGDFTRLDFSNKKYDHLISLLVFLHIPNKDELFLKCAKSIRSGGGLYIEDYFIQNSLEEFEKNDLLKKIACSNLQTREEYLASLKSSGFTQLIFEDMTDFWKDFLAKRWSDFQNEKSNKIRIHGQEAVTRLSEFYEITNQLFSNGNLGGVRIHGKKA